MNRVISNKNLDIIPIDNTSINVKKYLEHALRLTKEEETIREELMLWLPENIIDSHAHCNLRGHVKTISSSALAHMLSTFPYFSLRSSINNRNIFFPGKNVQSLRFANVFKGLSHRLVNNYLLNNSPEEDRVALFGLPEDVKYTIEMLEHPRVSALKMYYSYTEPPATKIYDIYKPEILSVAQSLDIPILLHMPKMIIYSVEDLKLLLHDFPRLKVCIAHLGSTKFEVKGLGLAYETLSNYKNVYLDTALNPSTEVIKLAIKYFGIKRVMYGSDEPLNMIRSVPFIHPLKGQRIATDFGYHWVDVDDSSLNKSLTRNVVHSHWSNLLAIRSAIESLPESKKKEAKNNIFYDNARVFYGF